MTVNMLALPIFGFVALILFMIAGLLHRADKKLLKRCTHKIKGTVIRFTFWDNNGVHFPLVEYVVDNVKYQKAVKYNWVVRKSSPFHGAQGEVKNDIYGENLVVRINSLVSRNPLREHFPVGTQLDVFYDPQNPKKAYVMRFCKNVGSKVLFWVGVGIVVIGIFMFLVLPKQPL